MNKETKRKKEEMDYTIEEKAMFMREALKEAEIALDHDEKGQEATEKLIKKYQQRGFEVCKYQYPEQYKDINDYLKLGFQGRKIPLTRGRL